MGCGGSKANTADPNATSNGQATKPPQGGQTKPSPTKGNNNNNNNSNANTRGGNQRKGGPAAGAQSKYVKPDSSYGGSVNGEALKEASDKGYNRRLRNNLINATQGSDIEALEKAKEKFEKHRLEDCGDLTKANERLHFLKLRKDLRDAVRRSHVGVLERSVADAEASPYAGQLSSQIEAAKAKIAHLKELNKYSHDILAMDQSTISELHTYHRPPACVHDVMAATYMLLGHDESTLRDWEYVQSMTGRLGKDSLMHKVKDFDSSNVDENTSKRVREIINYHELDEVRTASNGAATFHVWATNIVDKVDKDKVEAENQTQKAEEDRRRQSTTAASKGSKGSKGSKRTQK